MHAVRRIQADALAVRLFGVVHHFVNIGRTEILARVAVFCYAARVADVRIVNDQMRRLIFFVLRSRVIKVGELIESKLAVAFRWAEQMRFVAAVGGNSHSFFMCL